jgi:hypothetical protein
VAELTAAPHEEQKAPEVAEPQRGQIDWLEVDIMRKVL